MVFVTGFADTDEAVLLTVPAGKQFAGSLTLSATVMRSTVGTTSCKPKIVTAGTGVDPVAGSVLLALAVAAQVTSILNLAALPPTQGTIWIENIRVMAPPGNAVTLVLDTDGANVVSATAFGSFI